MSRSVWKGPFVDSYVLKKVRHNSEIGQKKPIKVWSRRSMILPEFVGVYFDIYNGKKVIHLFVTEDMIGHKFGEFASTRKKLEHKKKKTDQRKR